MAERPNEREDAFLAAFRGSFTSTLRWHQFEALWELLGTQDPGGWYVYAVGEPPPEARCTEQQFTRFLLEIAALLRREHDEDYCGIVYADDLTNPAFVKIFDPNNLGVSCGYSNNPPLPGWILSKLKPVDLPATVEQPAGRKRWWRRLFG
ncbi:MAG: hypothetical protein KDI18_13815 [Gammaproteobacteria bacterium]|nr:hypothetical protein [Gammaproteobacteria bacterium]